MKKIFIIVSFAALSVFAGCNKESLELTGNGDRITFSVLNDDTKTVGITTLRFNSGDVLSVFDSELSNNEFSQVKAGTAASTDYTGTITSGSSVRYVVYPYADTSSVTSDGTMTVSIPSHYKAANSNSILRGMNLSVGVLGEGGVSLKNVFGIVGVNVPNFAYGVSNVKLSANEPLVGKVSFKYNDGEPMVTGIADGATSVDFDMKLNASTGRPEAGLYYFCVVPGTYTGVKLTLTLYNGKTVEFSTDNQLVVGRNTRTLLKDIKLSDLQTAPAGELTLSMDFSTNTPLYRYISGAEENLPTSAKASKDWGGVYYFDQGEYSYPFFVGGSGSAKKDASTTVACKYQYSTSLKALQLVTGYCYIITPAIPGKKLSGVRFAHGNSATTKATTKNIVYYSQPGMYGSTLKTSYPENVISSTRQVDGDPAFGEWTAVTADANSVMFIYSAETYSNTCICKLELKYVDAVDE